MRDNFLDGGAKFFRKYLHTYIAPPNFPISLCNIQLIAEKSLFLKFFY